MRDFSEYVFNLKRKIKVPKEKVIFVCIGSNKVIWDSIGPKVGSILKKQIGNKYVIGDIRSNICSEKDLIAYHSKIKEKYIIAIDSALEKEFLHGEIFVTEKPIVMGLGVNRNKGKIGDIGIKIAINKNLVNRKTIEQISEKVARGILYCYKK